MSLLPLAGMLIFGKKGKELEKIAKQYGLTEKGLDKIGALSIVLSDYDTHKIVSKLTGMDAKKYRERGKMNTLLTPWSYTGHTEWQITHTLLQSFSSRNS